MFEPDRKTIDTTAARLALRGYSLTETAQGYRVQGHGVLFSTPMWPKVALFLRLQRNTSGEAGKHDANHGT